MKRIFRILLVSLTVALLLALLTGCAEAINGFADKINVTTCKLFGHSIELVGYRSPTCAEKGYTGDAVCSICGYTEMGADMNGLPDHKWADATCTSPKTCSVCGLTDGEPIEHTLTDADGKAATCTEDGYTAHKICECGYTEGKNVVPAEHAWDTPDENGTSLCVYCQIVAVSTEEGLKKAVTNAEDNAVILVKSGEYEGISFTDPHTYTVKNLTILGEDGAVLKGLSFNNWSPVEDSLVIDGLTIKNITFDTNGILLGTASMSNVTVEECSFINDACIHQNDRNEKLTGLVVKNCEFVGDMNGTVTALMLENIENLTVVGCTFTSIDYNVLQTGTIAGVVLIDGNTVDGTGDRVFRFVSMDADMTISNNTITSDGDDLGELAKASNACEITLEGNTWNGAFDEESADKFINITAKN